MFDQIDLITLLIHRGAKLDIIDTGVISPSAYIIKT